MRNLDSLIEVNYVYLDYEERKKFANLSHEYIIEKIVLNHNIEKQEKIIKEIDIENKTDIKTAENSKDIKTFFTIDKYIDNENTIYI